MGTSFYGGGGGGSGSSTTIVVDADWNAEEGQQGYIKNKPDIDVDATDGSVTFNDKVTLTQDPTEDMDAATKEYVDQNSMNINMGSGIDGETLVFSFG